MRLVAFSVAEIYKSMVRAPTWKVIHLKKLPHANNTTWQAKFYRNIRQSQRGIRLPDTSLLG
ncbi:hypothetical protein UABAM_02644 [Candidatus Uabimicrobium amorphum]|uniref:Uncharacterized protein n=1 Tax=Uabimicrobium amorphum TaxID=2596890 RepID=A0A5S9IMJ9_UABAM|nr:hypothetical protein UABAM_02644 [Candidatus Uabimicrobium amorphum]